MTRIASLAANNAIIQNLLRTQTRMFDAQRQVSTEQVSDVYSGISRDSERLVNLENMRTALSRYIRNNETQELRLGILNTSVEGIEATIREFQGRLTTFANSGGTDKNVVADIQDLAVRSMQAMENLLNTNVDGQFIFAGSRKDTKPVDLGLTTLAAFQSKFDGARVAYPTTRDAHLAKFSVNSDTNNTNSLFVDASKFLTFRQDDDGSITTPGTASIEATSALFSNVKAGTYITVSGSASNNGSYAVQSVSSDGTKVSLVTEMLTDEAITNTLADEAGAGTVLFTRPDSTTLNNAATGNITFNAAADTIVATTGGSLTNISAGDLITISGSASNNGSYTVLSNDGTTITVKTNTAATFTLADKTVVANAQSGDVLFSRSGDTITATTAGAFSGAAAGEIITVAGTPQNNGTYTIKTVSADGKTVTIESKKVTDEGLSSGTTGYQFTSGTQVVFNNAAGTIRVETNGGGGPAAKVFPSYLVGKSVTVAGATTGANNTAYTVSAVSADGSTLTVTPLPNTTETDTNGTTFTGPAFAYTAATRMVLSTGGGGGGTIQIQPNGGGAAISGVFAAMRVGQTFTLAGATTAANNRAYVVQANDGTTLTVATTTPINTTENDDNGASISVFAAAGTVSATPYYSGDEFVRTHRVDDDRDFILNLDGVDPAFEKALRAMAIIAQGQFGTEGGLDQNFNRARNSLFLVESALDRATLGTPPYGAEAAGSIEQSQIDIGFSQALLSTTNGRHESFIAFLEKGISDTEQVDQLDAITRLLDDSRALEASFQALARIREISLINFLS